MGQFTETEIKLLGQLFGKGPLDALKALLWTTIPEGLDKATVSRYMQLARSMSGNDPTETQFLRWWVLAKTSIEMDINTALGASLTSYLASALIAGALTLAGAIVLVATLASPLSEPAPLRGADEQVRTASEWIGTIAIKRTEFGASKCAQPKPEDNPNGYYTCNLDSVMGYCSGSWIYCGGLDHVPLEPMTYSGPVRVDLSGISTPYDIAPYVTFLDAVARLQGPVAAREPDFVVNLHTGSILDMAGGKCDLRLVNSSCRVTTNEYVNEGGGHGYTEMEGSVQFTGSTFHREVKMTMYSTPNKDEAPTAYLIINEVISVQAAGDRK